LFVVGQCTFTVGEVFFCEQQVGLADVDLVTISQSRFITDFVAVDEYDAAARKALRSKIERLGLELVCLAGYTDFTAGVDKDGIPNAEIQARYVGELAKLASDLGTDMVRIFTGYERPGIPFDKQYVMVVEGLKLAGQKAAQYGVTLAVQNHHDIAVHHDMMYWLLSEVNLPNIKAAFDAWSPTLEGLNSEEIKGSTDVD